MNQDGTERAASGAVSPRPKVQPDRKVLTPEEFLEKLKQALKKNGDFPASARVVSELRMLTSDSGTSANRIAEVILKEPSLGVRVLHLVNSAFYKRSKPISTITQAVVQIGMKPLVEMCGGLVLLQRFVPEARQNGAFALCLRKSIMTSLISSALATASLSTASKTLASRNAESGYLAGTMAEIGTLLMAFYFPQVYESAVKRAELKQQDIYSSIKQIVGFSPAQLSTEVITTLNLPQYYANVVNDAHTSLELGNAPKGAAQIQIEVGTGQAQSSPDIAECLSVAVAVSDAITRISDPAALVSTLEQIQQRSRIQPAALEAALRTLHTGVQDHCASLELGLPPLPAVLETIDLQTPQDAQEEGNTGSPDDNDPHSPAVPSIGARQAEFEGYLDEIEGSIRRSEPTASILTTVMEACVYCLRFDRAVFLLANQSRTTLAGRMMLGNTDGIDPKRILRSIGGPVVPQDPDNTAFIEGRVVCNGEPLLPGGGPLAVIPVGCGKRAVGVVYVDRTSPARTPLTMQEQSALTLLADLLDRSLHKAARLA